mmetsp:Transcript_123260/g.241813  ORF Transcript_123260/g.241813 Transcript_123260/m.241813 type:complete len:92 (-) Transcript_123260:717-992(-)
MLPITYTFTPRLAATIPLFLHKLLDFLSYRGGEVGVIVGKKTHTELPISTTLIQLRTEALDHYLTRPLTLLTKKLRSMYIKKKRMCLFFLN